MEDNDKPKPKKKETKKDKKKKATAIHRKDIQKQAAEFEKMEESVKELEEHLAELDSDAEVDDCFIKADQNSNAPTLNNTTIQAIGEEVVRQINFNFSFAGSNFICQEKTSILKSLSDLRPTISVKDFNGHKSSHIVLADLTVQAFYSYVELRGMFPSRKQLLEITKDLSARCNNAFSKYKSSETPSKEKLKSAPVFNKKRKIVEEDKEPEASEEPEDYDTNDDSNESD